MPKDRAIVYIDKSSVGLYTPKLGRIVTVPFPTNAVSDIELMDYDSFDIFMKTFLDENHILPHEALIILSPQVIFEKKIMEQGSIARAELIQEFNDAVPFDDVASKIYTIDGLSSAIATNNELLNAFKRFFKANSWYVLSIMPMTALDKPYASKTTLDNDIVQYAMRKFDELKQLDMSDQDEPTDESYFKYNNTPSKHSKTTVPILLAVFAVLIGVLGFLLWMQRIPQQPINATVTPTAFIMPTLTPTLIPTLTATDSATLKLDQYKVQVLNGAGPIAAGETVRQTMQNMGFKNILVNNIGTLSTKSLIVFSNKMPPETRVIIINNLKQTLGDLSVQETTETQFDIILTIGKP